MSRSVRSGGSGLTVSAQVTQHLVELFLGYLSTRVPLSNYADWFVFPILFTPVIPSGPPVQGSYDEQYEEYDHENEKEFTRKVSSPCGEEVKHEREQYYEPDR